MYMMLYNVITLINLIKQTSSDVEAGLTFFVVFTYMYYETRLYLINNVAFIRLLGPYFIISQVRSRCFALSYIRII